jgi:hypothetical protein
MRAQARRRAVMLVRRGKLFEDRYFVRSPFTHVVLEPLCLVQLMRNAHMSNLRFRRLFIARR